MVRRRSRCSCSKSGRQGRSIVGVLEASGVLLSEVVGDRGAVERVNDLCGTKWFGKASDVEGEGAVGAFKPGGHLGGILGRREADNAAVGRVLCRSIGGEEKVKGQVGEVGDEAY